MSWKAEFAERVRETEGYFDFLMKLDGSQARLHREDATGAIVAEAIDPDVLKTLKAASLLILYNLVESAIKNAIETIYDDLKQKDVSFDDVRDELKRVAMGNLRRKGASDSLGQISTAADILTVPFKRDALFAGNIDARKIRETAKKYGFSSDCSSSEARGGTSLLAVKNKRNDLAHGNFSFGEVGRDYTVSELVDIKREVIAYLTDIVSNIEDYVSHQHYLASKE